MMEAARLDLAGNVYKTSGVDLISRLVATRVLGSMFRSESDARQSRKAMTVQN